MPKASPAAPGCALAGRLHTQASHYGMQACQMASTLPGYVSVPDCQLGSMVIPAYLTELLEGLNVTECIDVGHMDDSSIKDFFVVVFKGSFKQFI